MGRYNAVMVFLKIVQKANYLFEHLRLSTRLILCYLAFALGCTVGLGVMFNSYSLLALFAAGCVVLAGARFIALLDVRLMIVIALFFMLGIARSLVSLPIEPVQGRYSFDGVVAAHPEARNEETVEYVVRVKELRGKVLIGANVQNIRYGDFVRIDCRIEALSREAFLRYWQLRSRGVNYACDRGATLIVIEPGADRFFALLADAKQIVERGISRYLPDPERTLALGMLIGERGPSDSALNTSMRRVGLSHIAVVSGYNIALIGTFIFACMFSFGLGRKTASVATVLVLAVFALFVGLDPSVVRSAIMYSTMLFVYVLDRPKLGLYVVCLTAFALLAVNPFLIRNVSFLLSFASVAGLSLTTKFWEDRFMMVDKTISAFLVPTFAAQTGALPVVIWYFGSVSIVAPIINVLILPFIPFAMALAFGTWLLSLASVPYAGWVSYPALTTIVHVSDWFARLPFAMVGFQALWLRVVVLAVLIMVYGLVIFRRMWLPAVTQRCTPSKVGGIPKEVDTEVARMDSHDVSGLK